VSAAPTRDRAIVLRPIRLGETSKIVSVLSHLHGRIRLVARGARNVHSRVGTLLEPGNELELLYYARPGRDLWTLGEASLVRAALTGVEGLDKLSHLLAAVELADRLLPEQESLPELEVLYRGFLELWHRGDTTRMASLFFALELGLLEQMGLGLDPTRCSSCGRELLGPTALARVDRVLWRASEASFECPNCARAGGRWLEGVTLSSLGQLRWLGVEALPQESPDAEPPELSDPSRREIGRLLHEHMGLHLSAYRLPRALFWTSTAMRDRGSTGS
jgi:DNA repair protein RecO